MRECVIAIVLASVVSAAGALVPLSGLAAQEASRGTRASAPEEQLPPDVNPDTRNRLPGLKREDLDERGRKAFDAAAGNPTGVPRGAAAIRLHGSGLDLRWESPLGRRLTELAILTSAREHDQPYEWSLHEMEAMAVGLDPAVIDVVRHRRPLAGLSDREAIVVQLGREVFGRHALAATTYARALTLLSKSNLVDIVDLMATYAGTASRLTAVNQQMPPDWKQFLPLPFTLPDDIFKDSRSRLPLVRAQNQNAPAAAPRLYSRTLAPEGTGPGQIARHGAGQKSLEASVGRRLMSLAVLVTAREHDEQYDWTMNEIAALEDGLEPAIIDVVRYHRPLGGLGDKESAIVQFGRELYGRHVVAAETYARGLKVFGERDLMDFVGLMAQHAGDAALLTAFDQHLPAGQKMLLPIP
jgi:4-carboxymuconolactone decarboxylase